MTFEHRHYLSPLFEPSSILAIVDPHPPAGWVARLLERLAGSGVRHALLDPAAAGPSPQGEFDLALIAVAPAQVAGAVERAAQLRCRAAAVLSSDADPADAQRCRELACAAGMRLLGPGTMGFVRPSLGLDASRIGPMPAAGNVALVSQSGMLAGAILDWAGAGAGGFSLAVSLGAEVDVDLAQVLDYLASDGRTKSVVLYLEAVGRPRAFMSALRALATVKPVVVLKGHRDDGARARAQTHSGAICAPDAIYSAALRRAGAVQVRLMTQIVNAARILASHDWPVGRRLAVLGNGSGPAALAADMAAWNAIALPPPTEDCARALGARLAGRPIGNPLNLGVDAGPQEFADALAILGRDPGSDVLLVMFAPHAGVDAAGVTEAVVQAARGLRKPLFACWMGDATVRPLWRVLDDAGVPVYRTPESAVDAYATVAAFHQNQQLLQQTPRSLSDMAPPDLEGARMLIEGVIAERRQVLTEMESKALLGAFHVPVTRTVLARTAAEAIVIAEQIGFPLAMKVASQDITRKSDIGGVVLDVRSAAEVRREFGNIVAAARRAQPAARIEGVTLQPMRGGSGARELYVGAFRDPLFGPVIAFGAGGRRLEVVRDTTLEFPPLNRFLARRMIERTRVFEALGPFRGAPAIDFEQLERLLVRVSEMVCELPWIAEVDVNPVIADEQDIVAVDARVVIDRSADGQAVPYAHLAILPYPGHLTQLRTSPDGRLYTIRAIRPEDADLLQRFVREMSEESRYFRFVSSLQELTPRMLVRYTQVDYDRELALVAVVGPDGGQAGDAHAGAGGTAGDERIIGVVRYLLNPDGETCEFAIAIADDWQGRRLGSTLMQTIVDAARAKGLRRIEGYVLAGNAKMLGLMSRLGFAVTTWREDPTMKLVSMPLS